MSSPRDITIAVFSKPPVAGAVKTRLAEVVGADGAAHLAEAFLLDTLSVVRRLPWSQVVLSTSGAFPISPSLRSPLTGVPIWDQGSGDLGARMERILRRGLDGGAGAVVALGADIPGLPPEHLEEARVALEARAAVIGPSGDGGYYLLGVRSCPEGMLAELPWSSSETLEATERRLEELDMPPAVISGFSDIDVPEDLTGLVERLKRGELTAPATEETLRVLGLLNKL